MAEKHLMSQIEAGKTNRVVFGNQNENLEALAEKKWNIFNPIDFLSYKYFDEWNKKQGSI